MFIFKTGVIRHNMTFHIKYPQDVPLLVFFNYYLFIYLFVFLGSHSRHMKVPRLRVESELQPLAYTTATATQDPTPVCNLYHSSRQGRILNPLSKAARPGIKPSTTSLFLVGFVSTVPGWELRFILFNQCEEQQNLILLCAHFSPQILVILILIYVRMQKIYPSVW